MDTVLRDVRQGLRLLLKERTFSLTVLVTLAVCLAANVAIYSVVHAVLLEPLPFERPEQLVHVYNSYPRAGATRGGTGAVDFFERRRGIDAFQEVALRRGTGATVGEAGATERISVARVTPSFFPLLGVEAALGRTFPEEAMEPGNDREVVLTHGFWQEHFGGAPDVVGRELRVDGVAHEVVGVLAEDFLLPQSPGARFFLPEAFSAEDREMQSWHSNNFEMIARLRPGATVEQARAQNRALNEALIERFPIPNARQLLEDAGYASVIVPAGDDLVRDVKPILYMLWGGVAFVLVIGCVNIANLMLARAQGRIAETATKLALGASRGRVARQILTEAVVLGVAGGVVGVGLGALGLRLLMRAGGADLPRGTEVSVDASVVAFTLILAVGAGALLGAIPVAQVMRRDLSPVFRTEGRTGTSSRRAVLWRNGLVTAQVALAFVMLIGAGLMLLSFRAAVSVDPGFEPDRVVTAFVSLPSSRYESSAARRRFWDELLAEVRTIPGVEAAGLTSVLPFSGNSSSSIIFPEGYVPRPGESILSPLQARVGPGYFDAMGIELLEGRAFEDADGPEQPGALVIDEWLAERFWPEGGAVGSRMVTGAAPGADSIPADAMQTVVGVVRTVKHGDLTAPEAEHVGAYYFTYRQQTPGSVSIVVRSATEDPASLTPALRATLARLDPELPLFGVQTMRGRIDESLASRRVPLALMGVFGGLALFLAVVGIYGALAYSVSQRRREIGIRLALGSSPSGVFRSVVREGVRVTALGLALGAVGAFTMARLIESLLFGVRATDPRVMLAVAGLLALVGLAACVLPARRATGVDPAEALTA